MARAVAIVGMVAVHIGPTDDPGALGRLYAGPHGRASILFVVVAGVGISLLTSSSQRSTRQTRLTLAWRALLLLPLGLALQELEHGANVILQAYAVLFVLALLVLAISDRWLLVLAATSGVLGPVAYWWGRAVTPEVFDRTSTTLTDTPGDVVHGLVLSGSYPLVVWASPLLFGMWLGRRDLRSPRTRIRLMLGGALAMSTAVAAARALVAGFGPPSEPGDPRHLMTSAAHSQMPLWLIGGVGAAAFALGACAVLADRAPRATWPFAVAGQLALTVYVVHLLALHAAPARLTSQELTTAMLLLAAWTATIVTAAMLWKLAFANGPLELVLRPPLTRVRSSSPRIRPAASGDGAGDLADAPSPRGTRPAPRGTRPGRSDVVPRLGDTPGRSATIDPE